MNLTIDLLRTIGSPFTTSKQVPSTKEEMDRLCQYSIKNRMLFLYLDTAMSARTDFTRMTLLYQKECLKLEKTEDAISETSEILRTTGIKHAVMKTIRPYRSTTVDIDTLIFGPESEYERAIQTLLDSKYKMLGKGPQSATLQHPNIDMKVDVYNEVAVSHIIYLDKQKLGAFHTTTKLADGQIVETLTSEADLALVIAHSMIKEHMYTLSEFYTFVYYLERVNLDTFVTLVKESNIVVPTLTHATITALLHDEAFNVIPKQLITILKRLGKTSPEQYRVVANSFEMPHRYHLLTIARSLFELSKGKKSRQSMAFQLRRMLAPSFATQVLRLSMEHLTRETY